MRTLVAFVLATTMGASLALVAGNQILASNAPDRKVAETIKKIQARQIGEPSVVKYGQR